MPAASASALSIAVVGGGIAGLTAAFRLHRAGARVRLLEASDRVGGPLCSESHEGRLFELGPNTVPSTAPRLGALIDDLGLRERVQLSRPVAGRRLIWRRGRLHALPEKPPQVLTCSALGPLAKLRLFAEPLIPARKNTEPETLLSFGRRRLGKGVTAAFLDPFVIGVYAGRLDRLGVDALPRLAEMERNHGSLFHALMAQKRERDAAGTERIAGPPPLVSFPTGLETLPRTVTEVLGGAVSKGSRVTAIDNRDSGYRVTYTRDGAAQTLDVDAVVVATPAHVTAGLLSPYLTPKQRADLDDIEHPFVATVGLAYRREDVDHPLGAFGVLVASDSRLPADSDVLGVLFPSSIFEHRCPEGEATLTVMIGGARDPGAAELDDPALAERARNGVRHLLGARGEPTCQRVTRWPRAIPQYGPGHGNRIAELRAHLAERGGLAVAGNYLDNVGVEGAVASGDSAAQAILSGASF